MYENICIYLISFLNPLRVIYVHYGPIISKYFSVYAEFRNPKTTLTLTPVASSGGPLSLSNLLELSEVTKSCYTHSYTLLHGKDTE